MNSQASLRRIIKQRQLITSLQGLTYQGVRCSGGHGHSDHHYHYDKVPSTGMKYQIPSQEDIDYQLPKKGTWNERIHMWIAARWPVDRDDTLQNDYVNKFSAYYWFSSSALFQNAIFLRLTRAFFDSEQTHERNHHEGLRGVKTNENSLFLYKSDQADSVIRSRFNDFFIFFGSLAFLSGYSSFIILPVFGACLQLPRNIASTHYFTFHAELLPHTEQVVFHKAGYFGQLRRIYVDIKNLEKIEAEIVPSKLLWGINIFDPNMVFRDIETKEVFVFDSNGIWNEDTLKHKLLY